MMKKPIETTTIRYGVIVPKLNQRPEQQNRHGGDQKWQASGVHLQQPRPEWSTQGVCIRFEGFGNQPDGMPVGVGCEKEEADGEERCGQRGKGQDQDRFEEIEH